MTDNNTEKGFKNLAEFASNFSLKNQSAQYGDMVRECEFYKQSTGECLCKNLKFSAYPKTNFCDTEPNGNCYFKQNQVLKKRLELSKQNLINNGVQCVLPSNCKFCKDIKDKNVKYKKALEEISALKKQPAHKACKVAMEAINIADRALQEGA